jgi:curli biogenesis system outer membrane secretion channel CsgG
MMVQRQTLLFFFIPLAVSIAGFSQTESQSPAATSKPVPDMRSELQAKLLNVKRIYVESFGDDEASESLQAMVINALDESKRFIVTENKDKADAILKGRSVEETSHEVHATGEATDVASAAGSHSAVVTPSGGSAHGRFAARAMGIQDSKLSTETTHEARLAVRLVSHDGDVIWSTTQESQGAKFKGSSADVADKVVKQLLHELDKAKPNTM